MPLFDYRCDQCGRTEERLEKHDAPTFRACPCSNDDPARHGTLKRVVSAPSQFNLKGTGWYKPGAS